MEPTTTVEVGELKPKFGGEWVTSFDVGRRGADWRALCHCGKSCCVGNVADLGLWMAAHVREHVL